MRKDRGPIEKLSHSKTNFPIRIARKIEIVDCEGGVSCILAGEQGKCGLEEQKHSLADLFRSDFDNPTSFLRNDGRRQPQMGNSCVRDIPLLMGATRPI